MNNFIVDIPREDIMDFLQLDTAIMNGDRHGLRNLDISRQRVALDIARKVARHLAHWESLGLWAEYLPTDNPDIDDRIAELSIRVKKNKGQVWLLITDEGIYDADGREMR